MALRFISTRDESFRVSRVLTRQLTDPQEKAATLQRLVWRAQTGVCHFQGFLHQDVYSKPHSTSYQEQRPSHKNRSLPLPPSDTSEAGLVLECLLASQKQPGWRNWVVTAGLQVVPSTWGCHQQSRPCPRARHPCGAAHPREDGQAAPAGCQRAQNKAAPRTGQPWHICTTTPAKKKKKKIIQIPQVLARTTRQTLPDLKKTHNKSNVFLLFLLDQILLHVCTMCQLGKPFQSSKY